MKNILVVIADFILVVFAGFVFSLNWNWFVYPLGVPSIETAQSVGIMLIIHLSSPLRGSTDVDLIVMVSEKLVRIVTVLIIGYITSLFV